MFYRHGERPYNRSMITKRFDETLQAYQRCWPFLLFRVRFVSGEHIDVDHPEAIAIRGGVAVYISVDGTPTLFDHESVSEVIGDSERRSA